MSGSSASDRYLWEQVARNGPMGLTRLDWDTLEPALSAASRVILRSFLEDLEAQTKWISERTAAMRDEAERISLIGETMKRAGLRSYTDEKGRIFVAGRKP